ncbi:protein HGH1 homolog isoform X2 [Lycorma delicatula]|uniref:protein HGH1 homolog isoform X2 n=1 Tax=Lycorma delicatula TaxID=130591 RepID=UPI003F5199F3
MDYELLLKEIVVLLKDGNSEIRYTCIQQVLGLTGSNDSLPLLLNQDDLIKTLTSLMVHQKEISKLACLTLINLSAEEAGAKKILCADDATCTEKMSGKSEVISHCLENILNKECVIADSCCMLLCNLSRSNLHANYVVDSLIDCKATINKLIDAFCDLKYNKTGCNLDYLGPFFSNISQTSSAVEYLYESADRLLPFTEYKVSVIRRGGIVGMLRNFSFNSEKHRWMLSTDGLNILPAVLLPLSGPTDFPEDEMDKLPIELQYLPETKERDPDPDVRRMLLEILLQLCSTSEGREILRENNAYVILRELHKNVEDREDRGRNWC